MHVFRVGEKGKWAKGTFAKFCCQRCGFDYPYLSQRREEETGLIVCEECYDPVEPRVTSPPPDAPLYNPLPDVRMEIPPPLFPESDVVVEVIGFENGVYLITEDGLSVILI